MCDPPTPYICHVHTTLIIIIIIDPTSSCVVSCFECVVKISPKRVDDVWVVLGHHNPPDICSLGHTEDNRGAALLGERDLHVTVVAFDVEEHVFLIRRENLGFLRVVCV